MTGPEGPITGRDYVNWADQLRDVEDMLDQPDLRNEIAGVRDRARAMRSELKRNNVQPKWDLVYNQLLTPLVEVRKRLAEELLRRENPDALVPLDRDPVPAKYSELVRKYYEDLGKK